MKLIDFLQSKSKSDSKRMLAFRIILTFSIVITFMVCFWIILVQSTNSPLWKHFKKDETSSLFLDRDFDENENLTLSIWKHEREQLINFVEFKQGADKGK